MIVMFTLFPEYNGNATCFSLFIQCIVGFLYILFLKLRKFSSNLLKIFNPEWLLLLFINIYSLILLFTINKRHSSTYLHQICPIEFFFNDRNVDYLYTIATSRMWLLNTWNVADKNEASNVLNNLFKLFKFYMK
jgi:hypothetical protein